MKVPEVYIGPLDKETGIIFVPVRHEGNTQGSYEEADKIHGLANELLGRHTFIDDKGQTRPIGWADMLFVAPYNHQVS